MSESGETPLLPITALAILAILPPRLGKLSHRNQKHAWILLILQGGLEIFGGELWVSAEFLYDFGIMRNIGALPSHKLTSENYSW
jgi:hypothetical protein